MSLPRAILGFILGTLISVPSSVSNEDFRDVIYGPSKILLATVQTDEGPDIKSLILGVDNNDAITEMLYGESKFVPSDKERLMEGVVIEKRTGINVVYVQISKEFNFVDGGRIDIKYLRNVVRQNEEILELLISKTSRGNWALVDNSNRKIIKSAFVIRNFFLGIPVGIGEIQLTYSGNFIPLKNQLQAPLPGP